MTDCMPAVVREALHAECSSGESKSAKRSRRAADAAREFVADVAEHQTDSEDDDDARRSKAKVARKASAAPSGGNGARAKLPRPEGTAHCPRCNSDNTKFCYYNNYNIKQPRYLCKGCQRYWTEGGMLRNVPVGSGRRKSKNTQAREAEKAATADAAKQQSMIATGAFDTFQQMLMNPSLAYSAGGLGGAAAAAAGKASMTGFGGAVVTGMAPLPPIAVQPTSFGGFSGAQPGLPGFAGYPPAKPTDSGRMTAASDPAITALLGGPTTVTTSTVTTFSGGPAVELKGRDTALDARVKPTDSGAASGPGEVIAAQVLSGGASPTIAGVGGGLMYGAGGAAGPHSGFQSDWVAAAGQMQMAQQQLQQAAALQAQTHLRAAAVSLGQQQNPYLSGMWPYNTYSAGPSWAAAAYARLGQQQSWQSGAGSGQQMSGLSGASSGMDAGAALMPAPGAAAPMWTQPWSAHAGGPTWGPVGGVPTASAPMGWPSAGAPPPMDTMGLHLSGSGGSMMSGGSNNSTATLLGKKEASLS